MMILTVINVPKVHIFPKNHSWKKIDFLKKSLGLSLEIQMKLNISLKNLKTFICKGSHQKFSKDLSKHL